MSDPVPAAVGIGALTASGQGFEIIAPEALSAAGFAVTFAGDVNGDGFGDVLIGAPANTAGFALAGEAYVVFGAAEPVTVDLAQLGDGGIRIVGETGGDGAGFSVAAAGDVNGDGLADLLIGAPGDDDAGFDGGAAYVVFGTAATAPIALAGVAAGSGGYKIIAETGFSAAGFSVSAAGDVNGDGDADLLVGVPSDDAGGLSAGAVYVVFGGSGTTTINLDSVATGNGGFKIIGAQDIDISGWAVSAAGDVNGDGLADVAIGAPLNADGGPDAGAAYVVFGKETTAAVNLENLVAGGAGLTIVGEDAAILAGNSIAAVGDLNGDGLADLLIGTDASANGLIYGDGAAYVVYGQTEPATISLAGVATGIGGYRIIGETGSEAAAGYAVAAAGDLNGDGLTDFLIGAPFADGPGDDGGEIEDDDDGAEDAGAVYVVYGSGGSVEIRLDDVAAGIGGYKIEGAGAGDLLGSAVAGGSDINGDGRPDLVFGAPGGDGRAYVVFGPQLNAPPTAGGDTLVLPSDDGTDIDVLANDTDANGDALTLVAVGPAAHGTALIDDAGTPNDASDDRVRYIPGAEFFTSDQFTYTLTDGRGAFITAVVNVVMGLDLAGTAADDALAGGAGRDRLRGLAGNDSLSGGDGIDSLVGGDGNDTLAGGSGADTMEGGAGNDVYLVGDAADQVIEEADGGTDEVRSTLASTTLGDAVENLALLGGAFEGIGNALANTLTGNGGENRLAGGDGDDTLDGGGGADSLEGGAGDDVYVIDSAGDQVIEAADGGIDEVRSALASTTLGDFVERLVLTGGAFEGIGNALANTLTGNGGANRLSGGDGDDTLDGGGGGDTLDGGSGVDLMIGGGGDDHYIVDGVTDLIVEAEGGGTDTVTTGLASYTLAAGLERLILTKADGLSTGIGNALANLIRGSDAANALSGDAGNDTLDAGDGEDTLDGGSGSDRMLGGGGDDLYFVDSSGDRLIEAAGGGVDTVISTVSLTLGAQIENGTATGTAGITLSGNALANWLEGNAGGNTLKGGRGADTLNGLGGNDLLDGGDDTDLIAGGDGNDTIYGSGGFDTLDGGSGDDLFVLRGNRGEFNVIDGGDGFDTVAVTSSVFLNRFDAVNIEHWDGGGQTIRGNAGDNLLDFSHLTLSAVKGISGGDGADTLIGNDGSNDLLDGGNGGDWLAGSGGNDTLRGGTDGGADRLDGGAGDDQLAGGGGADTLDGGDGADTLDGGAGGDVLTGGAGDDVYIVDSAWDQVIEEADAGIDRIESSVSLTLGKTIENLTLRGSASLTATGNSLANELIGNGGNNTLSGLDGDDTLSGGGGKDTLIGGDGADRLSGGSGFDRFRYLSFDDTPVSGADTIDGFDAVGRPRGDVIDLAAIDANGAAAGDGDFQRTLLFGDQEFTAAGQIRIVDLGVDTLIELNGDEDFATVEAAIVVRGIDPEQVVWTADDFLL